MSAEMLDTAAEEECLHCQITEVIGQYMETRAISGLEVNLPDITDKIVESLAQFILEAVPLEERVTMIAYAIEHFGHALRAEDTDQTRHLN